MEKCNSLTVTAPEGAECGLYLGVPGGWSYASAIHPEQAIPATRVTTEGGVTAYRYEGLAEGVYHCAASLEGHYALCRQVLYTGQELREELVLERMAGDGYEADHVMLPSEEFIRNALPSAADTWGEEYAHLFHTPQFLRPAGGPGRHRQTTNEELADFLAGLEAAHEYVHLYSLGKSPKYGFDMPLVLLTMEPVAGLGLEEVAAVIRGDGKPTVQYTAQCHSTEPVSGEGALAMLLELCTAAGKELLERVDVYIIPRINPDGALEAVRHAPTTGEDMNRDYLRLNNAEVRAVVGAYNLFLPEVCVDGHEKRGYIRVEDTSPCADMELQVGAGAMNHPAQMTRLAMDMALAALEKGRDLGLRGRFYAGLASAMGGTAGSSYFGARNSLSFLVETPGQTRMGMGLMERRVMGQYALASTVIQYTADHARHILDTVRASREHMAVTGGIYEERDEIVIKYDRVRTGGWATPLLDVHTGTVVDANHVEDYEEQVAALMTRTRPTAYLIPCGVEHEQTVLEIAAGHAVSHYDLPAGTTVRVRQYRQEGEGFTLTEEESVCFAQGVHVFPNTVPSTVLAVLMEPDFYGGRKNNCLHTMGFLEPDKDGAFPLYRYCHDLREGKWPFVDQD